MIHCCHQTNDFDHAVQICQNLCTVCIIIQITCVILLLFYTILFIAPVTSPWESRRIKQELLDARAQIASLEERNKILFNHKKESYILFEKEKAALEHNINKSKLMVWK